MSSSGLRCSSVSRSSRLCEARWRWNLSFPSCSNKPGSKSGSDSHSQPDGDEGSRIRRPDWENHRMMRFGLSKSRPGQRDLLVFSTGIIASSTRFLLLLASALHSFAVCGADFPFLSLFSRCIFWRASRWRSRLRAERGKSFTLFDGAPMVPVSSLKVVTVFYLFHHLFQEVFSSMVFSIVTLVHAGFEPCLTFQFLSM